MTVDSKITWVQHTLELKKSFAKKLDLLKRSRFLPRSILKDFYYKVILPFVKYGLVLWGSCTNSDLLTYNRKAALYCRAAIIIFNLPKEMPSSAVLEYDHWATIEFYYKMELVKLFYKGYNNYLLQLLSKNIVARKLVTTPCVRVII